MKFVVSRTSYRTDKICPVLGAIKETSNIYKDIRMWSSLEEARKHPAGVRFLEDKSRRNFREEGGFVVADYDYVEWTIEINSLEELLSLSREEGELVISGTGSYPSIEIYDDYRE